MSWSQLAVAWARSSWGTAADNRWLQQGRHHSNQQYNQHTVSDKHGRWPRNKSAAYMCHIRALVKIRCWSGAGSSFHHLPLHFPRAQASAYLLSLSFSSRRNSACSCSMVRVVASSCLVLRKIR